MRAEAGGSVSGDLFHACAAVETSVLRPVTEGAKVVLAPMANESPGADALETGIVSSGHAAAVVQAGPAEAWIDPVVSSRTGAIAVQGDRALAHQEILGVVQRVESDGWTLQEASGVVTAQRDGLPVDRVVAHGSAEERRPLHLRRIGQRVPLARSAQPPLEEAVLEAQIHVVPLIVGHIRSAGRVARIARRVDREAESQSDGAIG